MFGEFGIGELLVTLVIFVAVPVALAVWILRTLAGRRRERDELRARIAALEAKQAPQKRVT